MASEERSAGVDLDAIEKVVGKASKASFFRLLSVLERMTPTARRIGEDGPPAAEAIRLLHDPSMAFSNSDISTCRVANREQLLRAVAEDRMPPSPRFEITTTFLGLSGSASPLPLYLSAEVAHEELSGGLRRAFLDVFHHRLLSLFYRGWARYSPAHEATHDASDRWATRFLALSGFDAGSGVDDVLRPSERLALMPVLAGRARTATGLGHVLKRVIRTRAPRVRVEIEQFTGGSLLLDPRLRMRLGQAAHQLGKSSVLGARVNDPANGFRLHLLDLPERCSADFLPGGAIHARIADVVRDFVREPIGYDMRLQFEGGGGLGFALSAQGGAPLGGRTFLQSQSAQRELVVPGSKPG